ncbi:MAG: hypothetical protein WC337_09575 [Candidatus Muiribacteriota bacterium]
MRKIFVLISILITFCFISTALENDNLLASSGMVYSRTLAKFIGKSVTVNNVDEFKIALNDYRVNRIYLEDGIYEDNFSVKRIVNFNPLVAGFFLRIPNFGPDLEIIGKGNVTIKAKKLNNPIFEFQKANEKFRYFSGLKKIHFININFEVEKKDTELSFIYNDFPEVYLRKVEFIESSIN